MSTNLPARLPGTTIDLFDRMPVKAFDGFVLQARRVEISGAPTPGKWFNAFMYAVASEDSSPYWVGDLWDYAQRRGEAFMNQSLQMLAESGWDLSVKSLDNRATVSRKITAAARPYTQSFGHADVVSALPPEQQVEWLQKSKEHDWNVRDLRLHRKASQRAKVIDVQATLVGQYRVILADPPWQYGNRPPSGTGAAEHYPTLTTEEIAALPVAEHGAADSLLALWVTAPLLDQGFIVGKAWGYTYKQNYVWDKVDGNFSHYTGGNHEHLLLFTRGKATPDVPTGLPDSIVVSQKSRVHSEKPAVFREIIERHWTRGPYLELFGRAPVDGWTVWGNDARLWPRGEDEGAEVSA